MVQNKSVGFPALGMGTRDILQWRRLSKKIIHFALLKDLGEKHPYSSIK
jgi:hypothetical protein